MQNTAPCSVPGIELISAGGVSGMVAFWSLAILVKLLEIL